MSDELLPSGKKENESEGRYKFVVALLFLLLSFSCVFCSSQSALWFIDRDRIEASMRSLLMADYGHDPLIALAPLSGDIAAEAVRDEELLALSQTPIRQGIPVAVLPNPLPTPVITPTPMPVTPVPQPTAGAPAPTSPPVEATGSPPPTPIPATDLPPTFPPPSPTVVPPTATGALPSPTSSPPTVLPPTSPPSTSPPSTSSPPTSSPPPTPTDIPPTVAFRAAAFSVNEGDGFARITVNLSYASGQTVRVNYATTGLTATAGDDYTDVSGTLTFAAGQTSRTIDVPIIDDNLTNEVDENVQLTLSNPIMAALGSPNPATLTIVDNDGRPAVRFSDPVYVVDEDAGPAVILVELSAPSAVPVTVAYSSTGVTATPGTDYDDVAGTLTFAAGQISLPFNVPVIDDNLTNEGEEEVRLSLSSPTNADPGTPNPARLIIADDDGEPSVQFDQPAYPVDEGVGAAVITATLSAPSALEVTVVYSSTDFTAKAGEDYTGVTGTLTFTSGQLAATFTVPITDDNLTNEGDEQVRLTLSAPVSATLGVPNPATLIIEDNDPQPEVQFGNADISVAENAATAVAVIPVSISAPSAVTVTVTYATGGGTATGGADYVATSGVLDFPPAQTSLTFTITIIDDILSEPNETVELILSDPINATLGSTNPATLTIADNDRLPGTCPGLYPSGEPNLGQADGSFARVACDIGLIIDLQTAIIVSGDGNPDYDLVYYEAIGVNDMGISLDPPEMIYLDLVTVSIAEDPFGPWIDVFIWGDGTDDGNTNLMPGNPDNGIGADNEVISAPPLVGTSPYTTGIQIDVDNPSTGIPVPTGNYRYVRIYSPSGGDDDGPEIDALEVVP